MKKFLSVMFLAAAIIFVVGQPNYASAKDYGYGTVVNCREWISLREYPSTEAPRLAKVPLGARFVFCGWARGTGFVAARYNGIQGYLLREYIKLDPGVG